MTDTPRTDVEEFIQHDTTAAAPADFARTLERELARMERLRFGADADRRLLRAELNREREKVRILRNVCKKVHGFMQGDGNYDHACLTSDTSESAVTCAKIMASALSETEDKL